MEHHTHHPNTVFLAAYGLLISYGVWMMIYGMRQMSKSRGSYLECESGKTMLFRKPLPMRRSTLAVVGFTVLMLVALVAMASGLRNPLPIYLQSIIGLTLPSFFLYLSGPDDIRLDGEQRTYERTTGWPWKPVTQRGTFEDIRGICITPRYNVLLLLRKRDLIRSGVVLSSSGGKVVAAALAEKVSQTLNLPIVPSPQK